MKPTLITPLTPTCPHLGKVNINRGFYACTHPEKSPGLYLCVKAETCPTEIKEYVGPGQFDEDIIYTYPPKEICDARR